MLRRVIRLSGISKRALSPQKPPILDAVGFTVAAGETCGLCGPGAAGKSVLLKILCGLVRPDAGTVEVAGVDLLHAPQKELRRVQASIGMLFQNNALFDSLTVYENVAFPLRQRALQSGERLGESDERNRGFASVMRLDVGDHRLTGDLAPPREGPRVALGPRREG